MFTIVENAAHAFGGVRYNHRMYFMTRLLGLIGFLILNLACAAHEVEEALSPTTKTRRISMDSGGIVINNHQSVDFGQSGQACRLM